MAITSIRTLITPFQFSSRKMQAETMLGRNLGNNVATETLLSMIAWYEMWVNPEKVNMTTRYINQRQDTARGSVTFHYRKDVTVMQVEGYVGYVMVQSRIEEAAASAFNSLQSSVTGGGISSLNPRRVASGVGNQFQGATNDILGFRTGNRNRLNNSPRLFLKRLKDLSDQPMYYLDKNGIEHYNTKYLKIFTKQYPDGVICEGYFNNFNVPESSDDAMTVGYNFEYIIENYKPVTLIQRMAGMFAGTGSVAGDALRMFS